MLSDPLSVANGRVEPVERRPYSALGGDRLSLICV